MAKKPQRDNGPAEQVEFLKNGTVALTFGGVRRILRRPTIGEERRLVEALEEAQERLTVDPRPSEDEAAGIVLGWWRAVFDVLCPDDVPLPDDDGDLPPWFLTGDLIAEVRRGWRSVPWGPGGSPTQQQVKALAPILGSLAGVEPGSGNESAA